MKRKITFGLLLIIVFQMYLLSPVYAAIETSDYDWILGKYNSKTKTFSPSNTSELFWNNMWVRTIGPTNVYNGADGTRPGSVIAFVDKNRPEDNGYPMVSENDWEKWISYFNGNQTYVESVLKKWPLKIGDNKTYKIFANMSELVERCGGKGLSYSNGSISYVRGYKPEVNLTASSYAVKIGQPFKLFVNVKAYTYYYKFVDVKLTGVGNTYIDQRYMSDTVNVEKNLYFSYPGQFRFTLKINDGVFRYATKEILINVAENPTVPEQPPSEPEPPPAEPDPNAPPVAKFSWPTSAYEDDEVNVSENSYDPDGEIVDWRWTPSATTGVTQDLSEGGGTISFATEGSYNLTLRVKDDDGASDKTTKNITILKPIPQAVISYSGTLKENRRVVLDSSDSESAGKYPIDHSKDEWTIEPVNGGSDSDIKYGEKHVSTQEVLFKKAGTYKIGLRVANSKYQSEWVYKEITIIPDAPPIANFIVPTIVFREPLDHSYAIIKLTDKSSSLDYDIISQRIWKYKFDSNNNGDFSDETWVVLDSNNNLGPYLRVNHVGKYLFDLEVKESFGQPTIPEFITDADYKRNDTTLKPLIDKISDVQNVAPSTSFTASVKSKADMYFVVGDIAPSKTTNLSSNIDSLILANFRAKNIDVSSSIVNSASVGSNIVADPSFETVKSSFNKSTSAWLLGGTYIRSPGTWDSTVVRTGSYSVKINSSGTSWSTGVGQKLTGWQAGKSLTYSVWVNLPRLNSGHLRMNLFGWDSSGSVVFDTNGVGIYNTTNGWVQLTLTSPETVPANVKDLYLRIFSEGDYWGSNEINPDLTAYIDDAEVHEMDITPLDTLFQTLTWRDGAEQYLVNLSDNSTLNINNTSSFVSALKTNSTNFYVLGTDANKALANSLIASNSGNGAFYYNTAMATSLSSLNTNMLSKMPSSAASVSYILQTDSINYQPVYSDYENDPKFADSWHYAHDPSYVDNNNGTSTYNRKTLSTPVSTFDKYGKYDIAYKAQDDPTNVNNLFTNYRLWSNPTPTSIIVHRKPIASFTVQPGTLYITDTSYDPDFQYKRPDKGIVEWYWQWKKTTDAHWTLGKPSAITQPGDYDFYLKVKDCYGVWSDPYQITVTITELNRPPNADFNWLPTLIYEADDVTLKNLSTDPDGDPITYQWTVFDPGGTTRTYTTKDAFAGNTIPGTYWVTLKVWDNHNASDSVTKTFSVNLLGITGHVRHTDLWNLNRITYNRSISGMDNSPRPYTTFWAGEKFILTADTTDTGLSATKAQYVTVTMPTMGAAATLLPNAGKTLWSGEMWQESFTNLPDGPCKFIYTATYTNGAVKTSEVWINISGSTYDYFRFHRAE